MADRNQPAIAVVSANFEALRKEWPEAPSTVYIGADPFFKGIESTEAKT